MLTGWKLTISKCFLIPQRYVVAIMGFFSIFNAFNMRMALSIAITEMVRPRNITGPTDDTCIDPNIGNGGGNGSIITNSEELFDWDEYTQGLILSSFYWGYLITHLPGGLLSQKFGGKYSLGLGILSTAIFSLITPVVAKVGDWQWLCFLRVCTGLGEGITLPAINAILAKWAPLNERSQLSTLAFSGSLLGTIIGNSVSGIVIKQTQDWASPFYLFGGIGILWFVLWTILCYSDPESHPFISDTEKEFLSKELANVSNNEDKATPWKEILTSAPVWALAVGVVGQNWGFYTMVSDLPKYMKDVLKYNIVENGLLSSLPYLAMWIVSMVTGWLCDWLINKNYISITFARKFFTSVASIGPAAFLIGASYSGCDRTMTVILFTIGMGFMGPFYCGMKVNALDLSPNFAGALMAIVSGIGTISGIISPYVVGALTEDHTLTQWQLVFWITFIILIVSNVVFLLFASGEEQWWNDVDDTNPNVAKNVIKTNLDIKIIQ